MRTIALQPTDGLVRGMKAEQPGPPGDGAGGQGDAGPRAERDRRAGGPAWVRSNADAASTRFTARRPRFEEQSTELQMFETGIKVIDLLEPYLRGGKIGLFGGAGVGKTVIIRN